MKTYNEFVTENKKTFTRTVKHKGKVYTLVYDEYLDLDTVTREDGEVMSSTNASVKLLAKNADKIFNMMDVKNVEYVKN